MKRQIRQHAARVALLALVVLAGPVAPVAGAAEAADALAYLGPHNPGMVLAVAPSPGWPHDPMLLAVRRFGGEAALVRTRDGGLTWERLAPPPGAPGLWSGAQLALYPGSGGEPVAFLSTNAPGGLFRSADRGTSWQEVLPAGPAPVASPDFARDGLAFALGGPAGTGFRSRDGGLTWEPFDPAPGQRLQQVAFSPAFAHDRTVFAVVVTGGFPGNMAPGVADTSGLDNTGSLGVLVSTDGGEQWSQASVGLEVGGVPFRHVMNLTVSPTFAADGTLFAFAWGRRGLRSETPHDTIPRVESALFRSRDRGASWAPVHVPPPYPYRSMKVVLSPHFAADGVALATDGTAGGGPRSFGCDLLRTEDWGETWTAVRDAGPSFQASCGVHLLAGPGEVRAILLRDVLDCATCMRWLQSLDAGLTWERIPGTAGDASPTAAFAPSPAYAADRTLFFGRERGGILALGPTLRSTAGTLPCESEPVGGFGRLWRTEPWLREQVGCPTGAERSVQVRERRYTFTLRAPAVGIHQVWQRRAYRLEDEPGRWFDLGEGDAPDRGGWHTRSDEPPKTPESPDATMREAVQGPDAVMSGAVQAFEAGTMLFLIRPDGGRVILALGESAWREFPDPPA